MKTPLNWWDMQQPLVQVSSRLYVLCLLSFFKKFDKTQDDLSLWKREGVIQMKTPLNLTRHAALVQVSSRMEIGQCFTYVFCLSIFKKCDKIHYNLSQVKVVARKGVIQMKIPLNLTEACSTHLYKSALEIGWCFMSSVSLQEMWQDTLHVYLPHLQQTVSINFMFSLF